MKLYVIIPLFSILVSVAYGQNRKPDHQTVPSEQSRQEDFKVGTHPALDSVQATFHQRSDSLKNVYHRKFDKLDSAENFLKYKLDSLSSMHVSQKVLSTARIDSIRWRVKTRIDKFQSVELRTTKLTQGIDSIRHLRDSALLHLNRNLQTIKDKTIGKLKDLNLPPEFNSKISEVTDNINGFKIPSTDLNIPSLPSGSTNALGKLDNLDMEPSVPGAGNLAVAENVTGKVSGLSEVTGKAGGYAKDVEQLSKGNLSDMKELPKAAEEKAAALSGIKDIEGQTQGLNQYKELPGKMQNSDSLKEFAVEQVKQAAVNHFAGKEEQLKQAMETIAKYKTKYASLNSISEIKKRPPNEIHGKPLIERIVPGIGFQIQKRGGDILVDFNPYVGFRFTGRLTAGMGWNQRVPYNTYKNYFHPDAKIFGPRAFGEFKLWKGFSPRVELELMNTSVPPITRTPSLDPDAREWVWGAFVGMKKDYRFVKNIKGTALVMMRLFNPDHKSPYADVVNVRFGFDFPMKKKTKVKN